MIKYVNTNTEAKRLHVARLRLCGEIHYDILYMRAYTSTISEIPKTGLK